MSSRRSRRLHVRASSAPQGHKAIAQGNALGKGQPTISSPVNSGICNTGESPCRMRLARFFARMSAIHRAKGEKTCSQQTPAGHRSACAEGACPSRPPKRFPPFALHKSGVQKGVPIACGGHRADTDAGVAYAKKVRAEYLPAMGGRVARLVVVLRRRCSALTGLFLSWPFPRALPWAVPLCPFRAEN